MFSKKGKYEIDMCSGPILSKMLAFTLPLMFSSILQLLFNAADIIVVGRYAGQTALAAVGSTTSLINLLTNLFVGLSVGANVTAARFYGAKQEKALSETVHTSVALSIISGLILTIIGVIGAREMLILMKTDTNVLNSATRYLRIYFLGMIPNMIYNFGSAVLRAIGDTKRPLYYLFAAGVINVILNLICVIGLNMDVAGVALPTVISQSISAALVIRCLIKETGAMKLELRKIKINFHKLKLIMRVGLPAGFQGVVFALSNVVIQSSVNLFGETVIAGNSAAANIEGFVYFAMNAFYQSTISFMSQNFGAKKYDRLNKILLRGEFCVTFVGILLGNAVVLFGPQLLGIYAKGDPGVIAAGMVRLKIICGTYALCGIMDVMVGGLRGLGYSVVPMIVSLIGACVLRLIWIATVFQIPEYHLVRTVYYSYPITWSITITAHVICYIIARRSIRKKYETAEEIN